MEHVIDNLSAWFNFPADDAIINQGSEGIRQQPINQYTSPMIIYKITPSVDYKWWSKRLDTQHKKQTNQNLIKVPKVVAPKNKKTLL